MKALRTRTCAAAAVAALLAGAPGAGAQQPATQAVPLLVKTKGAGIDDWMQFLADTGAGTVSAAGMLGLSGDAVHQVENVKDLVLALKGFGGKGEKAGLGLSITPARTSLTPMDLQTYASGGLPARLLGALTLGYAQGSAEQSGQTLDRKAFSLETSAYLDPREDPLLALAYAIQERRCTIFDSPKPLPAASPAGPASVPGQPPQPAASPGQPTKPTEVSAVDMVARAEACRKATLTRWNASRFALAYGGGRVTAGGSEHSLGRTWLLTAMYGFDHIPRLREGHALTLTLRRSDGEPLLQTLTTGSPVFVDRRLAALRYTVGSDRFKALAEASNARERQPTVSDAVFKRALGVDVKLQEKLWLGLRVGKKRKVDGNGEETASMLSLSYSPGALLKP